MDFPAFWVPGMEGASMSMLSFHSLGPGWAKSSLASTAWPSAGRAFFVPFRLPMPVTVAKIVVGSGASGGNCDAGIYDSMGNRVVAHGGIATVATAELILDVTDTLLLPGSYYWGLSVQGTTAMMSFVPGANSLCRAAGLRQADSAYPLPSAVTLSGIGSIYVPLIGMYFRSE